MKTQKQSKTVWFNVVMLILFVGSIIDSKTLNLFGFDANTTTKITAIIGLLTTVGNYVLRVFFTTEAITSQKNIETK